MQLYASALVLEYNGFHEVRLAIDGLHVAIGEAFQLGLVLGSILGSPSNFDKLQTTFVFFSELLINSGILFSMLWNIWRINMSPFTMEILSVPLPLKFTLPKFSKGLLPGYVDSSGRRPIFVPGLPK